MTDAEYVASLEAEREQKDRYFRESPQSPLPRDVRRDFDGLPYYPPDPDYRFELSLVEFEERDEITVETTRDGEQTYLRWGQFRFEIGGGQYTLTAFKSEADDERLWVPFKDATNGDTTYPAGRYLDLEPDDHLDDAWVLDFNRAYSPFCAHSEAYECPLVPFENRLDCRIEAGEQYEDDPR
ncbi:MAG: DUF1684 domain-containing protein [Halobacteriaceae archaeon]